jgi:methylenetetrahydrofolate dehydrogenase (NADP+)/methenyltetrahydrofolate cyclohydrolase
MPGNIIDGTKIADEILAHLREEVITKKLHPHLLVFLLGDNPSSQSYIRQKKHAAEQIGAKFTLRQLPAVISQNEFRQEIDNANKQKDVHGVIIQRPLPLESSSLSSLAKTILLSKDIDGFLPGSPYEAPVATAVLTILEHIYEKNVSQHQGNFSQWLHSKNIVIIGKGETAGKPIRTMLEKLAVPFIGIDQSTSNHKNITKNAEIIISCVGKKQIIQQQDIADGVILISVGLTKGEDNTLHGDYEEDDIRKKALYYTPTPGGVGPVNVACLMQNLVKSSILQERGVSYER